MSNAATAAEPGGHVVVLQVNGFVYDRFPVKVPRQFNARPGARYTLQLEGEGRGRRKELAAERVKDDLHVTHGDQLVVVLKRFFKLPVFDRAVLEIPYEYVARIYSDGLSTSEWTADFDFQLH
ncbi:hypothetical protein GCM10025771_30880 [Niveibacterium umoris]|uniref:Uncharacterized protein n=1 Tax=Niveibacterium umoris TaxID=1193620 RepID=A0A840BFA8_9RHOO|nr:hypothetical protein [Niveibacterium umoris]MBB4011720.1 hypothetical protein [Niveibacterium umoris]